MPELLFGLQVAICGSAAGAIQNLSREQLSKSLIIELNGVPPLTDLLFGSDVQSQVRQTCECACDRNPPLVHQTQRFAQTKKVLTAQE